MSFKRSFPATLVMLFVVGTAAVAGFAPFGFFPLPILSLAALLLALAGLPSRATGRSASHIASGAARNTGGFRSSFRSGLLGLAWGLGFYLAGVSWVYVSMHDVGGMAMPLALIATFLFALVSAVFPMLACALFGRWQSTSALRNIFLFAGLWTLAEVVRGFIFTGFPWLSLGYSQTPSSLLSSPLAGFAPVLGVYGVSLIVVLMAGCLCLLMRWQSARREALYGLTMLLALILIGVALRTVTWTTPHGAPLKVALLQGNIPQEMKWEPENVNLSLNAYRQLAKDNPAQLTVLPETALPMFLDQVPIDLLSDLTKRGAVMLGSVASVGDGYGRGYLNAATLLTDIHATPQLYAKRHLVPFGERIPPGFRWFFTLVNIPLSDFTPGPADQAPFTLGDQRIMPNICYEDLFGEELLPALPTATILVNLSNTAWFGHSLAQPQHLQISQMRALETGRPMLRATNTGMTAMITPDGKVQAVLPQFTRAALVVTAQGYQGSTPYIRWGNWLAIALSLMLVAFAVLLPRSRQT